MYVILSKDQYDDIHVICICRFERTAKGIVEGRKEKYKSEYCWYQKAEKVTMHAEIY